MSNITITRGDKKFEPFVITVNTEEQAKAIVDAARYAIAKPTTDIETDVYRKLINCLSKE